MSTWLQDGKSAMQKALQDTFNEINVRAQEGMPSLLNQRSPVIPLADSNLQSCGSAIAEMISCQRSYSSLKNTPPTPFSCNKRTSHCGNNYRRLYSVKTIKN